MKRLFLYFSFLLLFISSRVNAQVTAITAKVTDSKGAAVEGNFLLLDSAGKEVRKAGFSGTINVEGLNHSMLRLRLRSLMFADTTYLVSFSGKAVHDLGTLVTREIPNALGEVVVRSSAPMVRFSSSGNLQVNVAGTILASSSSVSEILSRTPGVNVSEGVISVQGKGEAIIYLNGVLITSERLASIPTSQISKIEVMSSPSARYDASGRAVILVTTKAPAGFGLNGKLTSQLTVDDFFGETHNNFVDLGYSSAKLSLTGNFSAQTGKGRELLYTIRERPAPTDFLHSELTTDWKREFKLYATYGLGGRIALSGKSSLSFSFNGNSDKLGGTVDSKNIIRTSTAMNSYSSSIDKDEQRENNTFLLDYTLETDSLGSNLFLGGQYASYLTGNDDYITEQNTSTPVASRFLYNYARHKLHIGSFQIDRSRAFNRKSKLEYGLRFSAVSNGSDNQFSISSLKEGPYVFNKEMSSDFSYSETIGAGYGSFTTSLGKLAVSAGLRAEWTAYKLSSSALGAERIKADYLNVFPNLSFSLPLGDLKMNASYAARITRPRYQALNPFVIYQDPFTTIEGNPELKPERSHAIELTGEFKGTVLKLGYTYTSDQLTASALRGSTQESYVLKSINISSDYAYLVSLTRPFNLGSWWQSVNTASVTYGKSFDDQYGFATVKTRPQVYLYTSNSFSVGYGVKLQLLAWYLGERYYSLRHDNKRSLVTLGVEKSMMNNKLKIGLSANDIFNKYIAEGDYNVGQTQIYYNRRYGFKYFRVMASYNFGGVGQPAKERKRPAQTENNRAN